ncbi:MAG: type II secretion system minor pseudopilin GspK [Kangiellaceae bacterium]|nr:type II secretion system minor pseudopilin GspK [Kangiellaceae bacterium]
MNRFHSKQKGTALVTVVLIAAVVIVMVIESVKTIRFQKQLSSNLINRDQAYSYLMGMEELAKIWLKRAFENEKEDVVHLNQPWAQDNITFPIDGGAMTATIKDMQSCFNLNTIAAADNSPGDSRGKDDEDNRRGESPEVPNASRNGAKGELPGQQIFQQLLGQVMDSSEVPAQDLAAAARDWMDEDFEPFDQGAEDDFYQGLEVAYRTPNSSIAHVSELRTIKGFSRPVYDSIKKLVCVLPKNVNTINVNTVEAENYAIIYAALKNNKVNSSSVQQALSERPEEGYTAVKEFTDKLESSEKDLGEYLSVTSKFFMVNAKAEIGKTRVSLKTIFERDEDNNFKVISRYYGRD